MSEPNIDEVPLRVLVVDDSAYNRQTITSMLESRPNVQVVGRATNGKEALKAAFDVEPDVITLDLEMPEMDGFAFLRLLMSKQPTPVLVISGYAQRENVFRALELGALDFIAKPRRGISPDIRNIDEELAAKIGMVRRLQGVRLQQRAASLAKTKRKGKGLDAGKSAKEGAAPDAADERAHARRVIGIGASTGGPPALQQLLTALPPNLDAAVVIAQHMPERFTRAFAERLDRVIALRVREIEEGMKLRVGTVYIAPGNMNVRVEGLGSEAGGERATVCRLDAPKQTSGSVQLTPSADHLFESLATRFGPDLCAVVLTGMGSDGTAGAAVVKDRGGRVVVEDPETAVMPGMPHSVVDAGLADEVVALESVHERVRAWLDGAR